MDGTNDLFRIIIHHKLIGFDVNVIQLSACLVINPITVDDFDALFNCMPVDRASDNDCTDPKIFILVGWDRNTLVCCLVHCSSSDGHLCFKLPVVLFDKPKISICHTTRCIC